MDDKQNVGGRDRLVRFLMAAGLSIVAVRWLQSGKRLRGLLAGIGALVFGFNATTGYCGANDALDIDTTGEGVSIEFDDGSAQSADSATTADAGATQVREHYLTCADCGEPIVAGQSRGPNSQGDIVHDDCP